MADIRAHFYLDCFTNSRWWPHVYMFLFAFHGKINGPNLMTLCTKLPDITISNIGVLMFRVFHLFKRADVCMMSLPQSIKSFHI